MSSYAFLIGGVMPYLAVFDFVVGVIHRIRVWNRTPQPGKMTLFPAADGTVKGVLAETLFFPSLFKGDKTLWIFSWVFHASLALVALGHLRVITGLIDSVMMSMGMSAEGINGLSATAGGAAGIVLMLTAALLLVRRFTIPRVREITVAPDVVALLLLLAIILSGNAMRFGAHFDLAETRVWAWSLLTFSPTVPASGGFLLHAFFGFLLLMYIPFSKVMHFGGIFFTQTLVKRS